MTALGLLLAASVAASGFAFAERIIVPMAAPLVGGGAAAAGAFAWRLVVEGRARREMKRAFASYLAPEVLAEVLRDPSRVALGGEQRTITVMFTDLQGFTGLAEHTRPQELVRFLNDYFTRMCAPILAERGVIDKFVGDAIMALFGAPLELPDHPARALRAALALAAASDRLAADLRAAGGPIVRTRIGLHTGEAVVGNMGSTQRFDYTAIGDTVNLAARLEGANRAFGTACLCSETTWGDGHGLLGRELGSLGVKGREAPIRVFTPVAAPDSATEAQRGLCARWQAAVAAAAARDRAALAAALQAVLALAPDDGPARAWSEALADADWDFTFRLDSK
jgi:adenylate cyclase